MVLAHPDPHHYSGTSELHATGDTLDLTRFHDVVCAEAEALGVIADAQARLDLTSLTAASDTEAHQQVRRDAQGRRDAKVRLYLHASLADVVAGATGATGARTYERTGPGNYLWTGPSGLAVLVTSRGTINLPRP